MSKRITYTMAPGVMVFCDDCDWTYQGKNGVGLAAQHCDRYGHTVHCDTEGGVTFCQEDSEFHQRKLREKAPLIRR